MEKFEIVCLRRWALLEHMIERYKIKKIIEVGTLSGDIGKRILREENIKLDLYLMIDKVISKTCLDLEALFPEAKTIQALSSEAVKQIKNNSIDLIFIDGDHTYEGCKADLIAYQSKLKKGGWMLVHDYHRGGGGGHPGVKLAVDEIWGTDFDFISDEGPNSARGITLRSF